MNAEDRDDDRIDAVDIGAFEGHRRGRLVQLDTKKQKTRKVDDIAA
jgi:hypothetical protein